MYANRFALVAAIILGLGTASRAPAQVQGQVNVNGQQMTFNNVNDFLRAIDNLPIAAAQKAPIKQFFQNNLMLTNFGGLFPALPGGQNQQIQQQFNNVNDFLKAIDNLPIDGVQKAQIKQFFQNGAGMPLRMNPVAKPPVKRKR